MKRKVMVFGTFDILHDGHRHFLTEARKLGEQLTVVMATDFVVKKLKGKNPRNSYTQRSEAVLKTGLVDNIIESDDTIGTWKVLERSAPNTIAVGYDQNELCKSITGYLSDYESSIILVKISPSDDKTLHSSIL